MFFERNDIKVNIISVLSLGWEKCDKYASKRPFNALSYRIEGNATFSHKSTKTYAKGGDVVFVPKDYDYHLCAENEKLIVVHFDMENAPEKEIDLITPMDLQYLNDKFLTLYDLWSKKQFGYEYECTSIFYKILSRLYKQKMQNKIDFKSNVINDAKEYIHDHFNEQNLTVAKLSAFFGMSDTYFRKIFVSAFGTTPLKYIINLRVSYAVELLKSGYFSVEEVAEKSGFDNQKYFSKVIKKQTGKSPTAFKIK